MLLAPILSVGVPLHNEGADILPLVAAIRVAVTGMHALGSAETAYVDDWSTGGMDCGPKIFRRGAFPALPQIDHMHRFLPTLILRAAVFSVAGVGWLQRLWQRPELEAP